LIRITSPPCRVSRRQCHRHKRDHTGGKTALGKRAGVTASAVQEVKISQNPYSAFCAPGPGSHPPACGVPPPDLHAAGCFRIWRQTTQFVAMFRQ
jgi:hypothetical protein